MMRLESGIGTARHRTTANNIYAIAQGEGESFVDGERFAWSRGDVIAVPPGARIITARAKTPIVLTRIR
jgi:gentisate 1,2-dioxygenase